MGHSRNQMFLLGDLTRVAWHGKEEGRSQKIAWDPKTEVAPSSRQRKKKKRKLVVRQGSLKLKKDWKRKKRKEERHLCSWTIHLWYIWHVEGVYLCVIKDWYILMFPRGLSCYLWRLLRICYVIFLFQPLFALWYARLKLSYKFLQILIRETGIADYYN